MAKHWLSGFDTERHAEAVAHAKKHLYASVQSLARERFRRIAGLTIGVERKTADSYSGRVMPIIGEYHLPTSIDVRVETNGAAIAPSD